MTKDDVNHEETALYFNFATKKNVLTAKQKCTICFGIHRFYEFAHFPLYCTGNSEII